MPEPTAEEQTLLRDGFISRVHEWTDAKGASHRCWDRSFRTTEEEMAARYADPGMLQDMLELGAISRSPLCSDLYTLHLGKVIQDGKIVWHDFMAALDEEST